MEKSLYHHPAAASAPEGMTLTSPAFADSELLPKRFTADGDRLSPPLRWTGVPHEAVILVLVVEDADSPTSHSLTQAIVTDLAPADGGLREGKLRSPPHEGEDHALGRNSFARRS